MLRPTLRGDDRMVLWNIDSHSLVNKDRHVRSHTNSFSSSFFGVCRVCVCVCVDGWGGKGGSYVICVPSTAALLYVAAWPDPVSPVSVCVSPSPCSSGISGGKLWSWSSPLIRFLYICSISSLYLCFIPPHLPVLPSSFLLYSL